MLGSLGGSPRQDPPPAQPRTRARSSITQKPPACAPEQPQRCQKCGGEQSSACSQRVSAERKPKGNYSSSPLTFSSYSFSEPKEMAVAIVWKLINDSK